MTDQEATPETLREGLQDCWYFTKDGCKCMYCEHAHPSHGAECPVRLGLAAADTWETDIKNAEHNPWTYRKCGELILTNEGLRKRLKASEQVRQRAERMRQAIYNCEMDPNGLMAFLTIEDLDWIAALAPKEKP